MDQDSMISINKRRYRDHQETYCTAITSDQIANAALLPIELKRIVAIGWPDGLFRILP